jgi:hypothetical protein
MGVYVKTPKYLIICEQAGNGKIEEYKATLDVCKTITPIGG